MRRQYIVDKKFQWTIVGYTFAISVLTTICHQILSRLEGFEQLQMLNGLGNHWWGSRLFMIGLILFLYISIFVIAILFSNRLAGPLYRLRRHMDDVATKKPVSPVHFRKDDYFDNLNVAYNKLIESLPPDRKKPNNKGFTIIELLAAVGILMILLLLATYTSTDITQTSLLFRQDVTLLQGILMTGRNAAMSKNECSIVSIVGGNTVQVNTYPMPAPCTGAFPPTDFQVSQTFRAGTTVSQFSVGPTLAFKPGGGTTAASPVTLTITSGPRTNTFTIYPAIGQVRHL
ncbi:MAG: prepilin-type N-terminal cleavage/methylation domain-containing protein [Bdellovibrionales bacterium]